MIHEFCKIKIEMKSTAYLIHGKINIITNINKNKKGRFEWKESQTHVFVHTNHLNT